MNLLGALSKSAAPMLSREAAPAEAAAAHEAKPAAEAAAAAAEPAKETLASKLGGQAQSAVTTSLVSTAMSHLTGASPTATAAGGGAAAATTSATQADTVALMMQQNPNLRDAVALQRQIAATSAASGGRSAGGNTLTDATLNA